MAAPTNAPRRSTPPAKDAGKRTPPAGPLRFSWVTFKAPKDVASSRPEAELPEGWGDDDEGIDESVSGIYPTADWQKPGEGLIGTFLHMRDQAGPNKQRVYTFRCDTQAGAHTVSVWGSTILDSRMDDFDPPINRGDEVMIMYYGDVPTKRAMSPAKDFRVKLKRAS